MNQVFDQVPIANLRFWSPIGSVVRFTILDKNLQPLETFTPTLKGPTPQSLATIKGSALAVGAQSVYVDNDSHVLVAAVLGVAEPTLPAFILQEGARFHLGTADVSTAPTPVESAPSTATPVIVAGTLAVLKGEELFMQNVGDAPVFVKFGTGASDASYHFILAAGTALEDGNGQAISRVMGSSLTVSYAFGSGSNPNLVVWKW